MNSNEIHRDWIDLLTAMLQEQVRFLIVGGHAVSVHGHPRYTEDLPIFGEISEINANRILKALESFFGADVGFKKESFSKPDKVVMIGEVPYRVDLLTTIAGVSFEEAYPRRKELPFDKITVPFIGVEDLLKNKKATGRPKDLGDFGELMRGRESG